MGDDPIKRVNNGNSLGEYIDNHLSRSNHVDHIAKISADLADLKQVTLFVPREILITTIYKSLILPSFNYCNIVWAGLNKDLSERVEKVHDRAARIITQSNLEIRSTDILKMLQRDTLRIHRHHHTAIMMHIIMPLKLLSTSMRHLTQLATPLLTTTEALAF